MKIFSLYMVVKIAYKVCTLNRESIRFGGGLVYEFRYLHHCNSYHLKSRKNDSYMMHVCILNNGPYKHPKSWKNTNIMNIQKKENNFLQKKKETLRHQYFKRFEVRFKMKTMWFFFYFRESNFFIIYLNNKSF